MFDNKDDFFYKFDDIHKIPSRFQVSGDWPYFWHITFILKHNLNVTIVIIFDISIQWLTFTEVGVDFWVKCDKVVILVEFGLDEMEPVVVGVFTWIGINGDTLFTDVGTGLGLKREVLDRFLMIIDYSFNNKWNHK